MESIKKCWPRFFVTFLSIYEFNPPPTYILLLDPSSVRILSSLFPKSATPSPFPYRLFSFYCLPSPHAEMIWFPHLIHPQYTCLLILQSFNFPFSWSRSHVVYHSSPPVSPFSVIFICIPSSCPISIAKIYTLVHSPAAFIPPKFHAMTEKKEKEKKKKSYL